MWNADFKPGTNGSDLLEAEVRPKSELLSSKARLESIASILALAVLRRRIRTTHLPAIGRRAKKIQRKIGEGLDSWREQSVHA